MKTEAKDSRTILLITSDNDQLFALCKDGTLWTLDTLDLEAGEWKELPSIPLG